MLNISLVQFVDFVQLYLLYVCLLDETEIVLTIREFGLRIFRAKRALKSEYYKSEV